MGKWGGTVGECWKKQVMYFVCFSFFLSSFFFFFGGGTGG
jgi:hypothetical protein